MDTPVLVAIIVFLTGVPLAGGLLFVSRWMGRKRDEILEDWSLRGMQLTRQPVPINYRGHLSQTVPLRGNGLAALTPEALVIVRYMPEVEWIIPLANITRVTLRRSWQGSLKGRAPVVGVYYRTDTGEEDAVGVLVGNAPQWAEVVATAAKVAVEDER